MKKALQLASVASMIDQFIMPNIKLLQSLGFQVDVVANFTNPGNISFEQASELMNRLKKMQVRVYNVEIPRNLNPVSVLKSFLTISKREYFSKALINIFITSFS